MLGGVAAFGGPVRLKLVVVMRELVAEAGTLERSGWPGGELQDIEPTQRVITKRVRDKAKGGTNSGDPYDILGVSRGATAREIRAAYLRLVKELHPDGRTPDPDDPDPDAGERLKIINEAYRTLKAAGAAPGSAGWRGWAQGAVFAVGVLTSALPLLLAIVGAYYAGWLGSRAPAPDIGAKSAKSESRGGAGTTFVAKDAVIGRQLAFADAKQQATKTAWAKFIADYPGGAPEAYARQAIAAIERAEAAEARKQEERLAWSAAEKGTKADLQLFIARFGDGEHADDARLALADIGRAEQAAWAEAERAGTKQALQRFLATHPEAAQAPQASKALAAIADAEAKAKLELDTWTKVKGEGSKAALHTYLSTYPSGSHATEAQAGVARLEAEESDDEAWRIALKSNSKAGYAGYLSAYPKGRRAAEAKGRIAELAEAPPKEAVKEARAETVKAPPVRLLRPPTPVADEPFVGADGRIRR
jgi:DnaJ-like protein